MNTAEQFRDDIEGDDVDHPSLSVAGDIVEVRRAAGLSAVVGALASAVAIAWFGRAISSGSVLDWTLVVLMGALGVAWLAAFVDARTPLLVADDQGVRLRLGRAWVGLPWSAVDRVEHRPRRGLLRDGLLNVVPHNPDRVLSEVGVAAARRAGISRRLYGGPFALPLGLGTRVIGGGADLTEGLDRLASREAEVLLLGPTDSRTTGSVVEEIDVEDLEVIEATPAPSAPKAPSRARALMSRTYGSVTATVRERRASRASSDDDLLDSDVSDDDLLDEDLLGDDLSADDLLEAGTVGDDTAAEGLTDHSLGDPIDETATSVPEIVPSETPAPVRAISLPSRGEVVSSSAPADDDTQLIDPTEVEFFEEDVTWGERVSPIARAQHAVAPLVVDDFGLEPAAEPVIGPELRAARTRIGLSTDQLADRTRIRPHVIEAIEVDDFVPCGGDFYARGHLRTLARVLGIDVAPLLVSYDERYANAPIDPRRVFEAELATGAHGSIRGTRGGPNWSILVAAVMALVLAWSVAQLVMDSPAEVRSTPVLNGSGGPGGTGAAALDPVQVKVSAPVSGAAVLVRDSNGTVVFEGNLAIGESTTVKASPPVRVQSSDGSVTVTVAGKRRGSIGEAGEPGQGTYAD